MSSFCSARKNLDFLLHNEAASEEIGNCFIRVLAILVLGDTV